MKYIYMLWVIIMLTGCSNYKQNFDCKAGNGLGCTPARKSYKIIQSGNLKENIQRAHNLKYKPKETQSPMDYKLKSKRLKVWVPPQKEQSGYINEDRYVDIIVKQ
jgi:hypothetical protein